MKLSRTERWMLSNQFNILAKLDPDQETMYLAWAEIVEKGYEFNYDEISEYVYKDDSIMTEEQSIEVINILEMYSLLKYAYDELEDKSGIDPSDIQFKGFDANTETTYMAYARFLIDEQEKFENLSTTSDDTGDNFNSHFPALNGYRKMLQEWDINADHSQISKSDIVRILAAK